MTQVNQGVTRQVRSKVFHNADRANARTTATVRDAHGCTNTCTAVLTVTPPPVCTIAPPTQSVCLGGTATFTASATGDGAPFTFAWSGPGGFTATGVGDITAAAGAPKGSFYNHFKSKEAFGLAVLDRYFAGVEALLVATLADRSASPLDCLRRCLDALIRLLEPEQWSRGCLIGNFALESSASSEAIRLHLRRLVGQWSVLLAVCIAEARASGQVTSRLPAVKLADFVLNAWEGAVLRAKVERSRRPLDELQEVLFATVLR